MASSDSVVENVDEVDTGEQCKNVKTVAEDNGMIKTFTKDVREHSVSTDPTPRKENPQFSRKHLSAEREIVPATTAQPSNKGLGWRDKDFHYVRQSKTLVKRNDKLESIRKESKGPITGGYWNISCIVEDDESSDYMEMESIFFSVNELYKEVPELFSKPPNQLLKTRSKKNYICCYVPDYKDKVHAAKVASLIRRKNPRYPCPLYFYVEKQFNESIYMYTCEGEFYADNGKTWTLIELDC